MIHDEVLTFDHDTVAQGGLQQFFIFAWEVTPQCVLWTGSLQPLSFSQLLAFRTTVCSWLLWVKDAPPTEEAAWGWLPAAAYDVSLKLTFQDPRSPMYWDRMGASYVWPPLGGTISHVSGTKGNTPGESSINSPDRWDAPWMSYGTRVYPSRISDKRSKLRFIGGYSMKGQCPYYEHYIKLPEMLDELQWRNAPPLPQGELAAPSLAGNRGSLQPPSVGLDSAPSGKANPKRGNFRIDRINQFKTVRGLHSSFSAGSTEPKGKGEGVRHEDANLRRLTKLRDRWEKLRMLTSQPIPDHCKTKPDHTSYDSPPRTQEELARPMVGTAQELERLFHMRFYYQPQDDMCRLAFKLSIDQGKNNYATKEDARVAGQEMLNEFTIEIMEEARHWAEHGTEPKTMTANEVFA